MIAWRRRFARRLAVGEVSSTSSMRVRGDDTPPPFMPILRCRWWAMLTRPLPPLDALVADGERTDPLEISFANISSASTKQCLVVKSCTVSGPTFDASNQLGDDAHTRQRLSHPMITNSSLTWARGSLSSVSTNDDDWELLLAASAAAAAACDEQCRNAGR